jgi:hypothetical protein
MTTPIGALSHGSVGLTRRDQAAGYSVSWSLQASRKAVDHPDDAVGMKESKGGPCPLRVLEVVNDRIVAVQLS